MLIDGDDDAGTATSWSQYFAIATMSCPVCDRSMADEPRGLLVNMATVEPEHEEAFNHWYHTEHINDVEAVLARITGQKVFRGDVYYFDSIPTDLQWSMVGMVNIGALLIAVD